MKKEMSIEERFPTKRARELADAAVDALPLTTPIGECMDLWRMAYKAAGGIDKREKK